MSDQDRKENSPAPGTAPKRSDERLDREAQALRDNLRRRKEQARARAKQATQDPSADSKA